MSNGKYSGGNSFGDMVREWERGRIRYGNLAGLADTGDPGEDAPDPDGEGVPGPSIPAPANLALETLVFMDNYQGHAVANVTATWDPVTNGNPVEEPDNEGADPDRSPITNYLTSYRVGAGVWSRWGGTGGLTTVKFTLLPVGEEIYVRVRAQTRSGQLGAIATASITAAVDTEPPPVPSAPTVIGTLRGVSVRWDGTFVAGAPQPPDFAYVQAQISLTPDFAAPIDGGVIPAGGGQTAVTAIGDPPFTIYARLLAFDLSRNPSGWSAAVEGGSIQIIPADVGEGAITTGKLADAAVSADKILNGAVDAFKLGTGSVTTTKLADLAVTVAKVVDGAIASSKLAAGAVTAPKISVPSIDPTTGNLAANSVGANQVAAGAIVAGKIAANAVTAAEIAADSVTANEIAAGAIVTSLIAANAVVASNIAAGAVVAGKIAADAVTATEIAALSVTSAEIAANAVTSGKVATNSLTSAEIAAGAITADELSVDAVTGKTITGGTFRTGVSGQDRIEIIDEVTWDPYLGINRSIRDTVRWIRGGDGAIAGELRGYMGDIGAYGLHLNSHVELGNVNSTIYQVGRRSVGDSHTQIRMGTATAACDGSGNWTAPIPGMPNTPTVVVCSLGADVGTNPFFGFCVNAWSSGSVGGRVRYMVGTGSSMTLANPGSGTTFPVRYYAECAV